MSLLTSALIAVPTLIVHIRNGRVRDEQDLTGFLKGSHVKAKRIRNQVVVPLCDCCLRCSLLLTGFGVTVLIAGSGIIISNLEPAWTWASCLHLTSKFSQDGSCNG